MKLDRTTGLNSKSKKQDKVGIQPSSKKEMVNDLVDENNNKSEKSSLPEKSYGEIKVVVGCFSQRKNIERFMNKLSVQGFAPFEEKHGRLTRVCIKATNDMSEAREFVSKSRSLGFKGWILK